ncbi:MAG TPA: pyridoxal-phosphate dependent enzyme [Micromonosporaceae bacterium]|nr:pyridoxal-phosphate dependent enzyme [Micromonosporaceae bacterium]
MTAARHDVARHDVEAAAVRIAGRVRRTPVAEADPGTLAPAGLVWLKLEYLQHAGAFKARGAFNRMLAGVATALHGRATVVAVEPEAAPTLRAALAAGGPVDVEVSGVAADSLGARRAGTIAYDVAVRTGVRSVLVCDEEIVAARRRLWEEYRIVVEHGSAAAFAALATGAYRPAAGERVAVLLCGANTSPAGLT